MRVTKVAIFAEKKKLYSPLKRVMHFLCNVVTFISGINHQRKDFPVFRNRICLKQLKFCFIQCFNTCILFIDFIQENIYQFTKKMHFSFGFYFNFFSSI